MLCIQRTGFIIIFSLFPLPNTCSLLSMLMNSPDGRHHFLWKQPATARNRGGERQRERERLTGGRTGRKKSEEKVVCAWMYNFHWKFPLFLSTGSAETPQVQLLKTFRWWSSWTVEEKQKGLLVCWSFQCLGISQGSRFIKMKIITLSSCKSSKGVGQDHVFIACCSHQE